VGKELVAACETGANARVDQLGMPPKCSPGQCKEAPILPVALAAKTGIARGQIRHLPRAARAVPRASPILAASPGRKLGDLSVAGLARVREVGRQLATTYLMRVPRSLPSQPLAAGAPAAAEAETARRFRYWQTRTLVASMVGYVMYYFVRKNLSVAMPALQQDLGISKADLGMFLTLHGLLYGVSKFANGYWGDRANARIFMVTGLVLSALANLVFGFTSAVLMLGLVWVANGWVQGMGFPPCARLISHWFPPGQLATKFAIWNTSHSIGAGLVVILCGYLAAWGWRWCFWGPAAIGLLGALVLWLALRDTPQSVGLPELDLPGPVATQPDGGTAADFRRFVRRHVFGNPFIWILSIAQFFVYTLRYAVLDWGPTLLHEFKGYPLHHAGWMVAAFEVAGVAGMLVAGWMTDRLFGGRGARLCVFCMGFAALFLFLFWQWPGTSPLGSTALLGGAGFFLYGPQSLVGTLVANLATKRAAATAIGLTGLFAYASTLLSGWGLGWLVDRHGWNVALGLLVVAGLLGLGFFALAWPARAHGYATGPDQRLPA
jgi:sugar phosphate permease